MDPDRNLANVEDLQRVQAFEMDDGVVYFRNLAVQSVTSEEEALNLVRSTVPRLLWSAILVDLALSKACWRVLHVFMWQLMVESSVLK